MVENEFYVAARSLAPIISYLEELGAITDKTIGIKFIVIYNMIIEPTYCLIG